jgi:hypothetical protein
MIRLVIGLPGNGKTLFCVSKIIDELLYSERMVITSCQDLKLDRLNAYLQERMPDRVIDLEKRILVLEKEEAFHFYRFRAGGLVLPPMPESKGERRMRPEEFIESVQNYFAPLRDKPEFLTPVSYFITEAHDYFNADEWQQRGRAVQYYASKHRHLHDELVLETQFPGQLDNKMRELVQETHELINNYQRQIGPFARRGGFERRVFYKVPKGKAEPFQTVTFTLDTAGVASCYHTTGALGIMERGAEEKGFGRIRRLPWWSMWAGAGAIALLVGAILFTVPGLLGKMLGSMVSATEKGMRQQLVPSENLPDLRRNMRPQTTVPETLERPTTVGGRHPDLVVDGYVVRNGTINVILSDGRTFTESDGVIDRLDRHKLTLKDGSTIYLKRAASPGTVVEDSSQPSEERR